MSLVPAMLYCQKVYCSHGRNLCVLNLSVPSQLGPTLPAQWSCGSGGAGGVSLQTRSFSEAAAAASFGSLTTGLKACMAAFIFVWFWPPGCMQTDA